MFDELSAGTPRRSSGSFLTVALAAHALALFAAIWLVREKPKAEATDREPTFMRFPNTRPEKPAGATAAPPSHPPAHRVKLTPRPQAEASLLPPAPQQTEELDEAPQAPEAAGDEDPRGLTPGGAGGAVGGGAGPVDGAGPGCIGPGCPGQGEELIAFPPPGSTRPRPTCMPAAPEMPAAAVQANLTGSVLVEYVVRKDGSVDAVALKSGPPVLYWSVERWLRACAFTPATVDGRPVSVRILQTYNFHLQ